MAMITDIVADHFRTLDDAQSIVMELDAGLGSVGLSVRMIRDMALHGNLKTGSSECDPEEIAALATGLLSYLGQLGSLVDRLGAQAVPSPTAISSGMAGQIERP